MVYTGNTRSEHQDAARAKPVCGMYKAAEKDRVFSSSAAKDDNSRRWILGPGKASFIAARLKVKPSIMSFSTAPLSVRSPGLGQ